MASTFTDGQCRVIQLIEPDQTSLTGIATGGTDQSLDESGIAPLTLGQLQVVVAFGTPKANESYKFEYLYVDDIAGTETVKFTIVPSVIQQTRYGFTVGLSGSPPGGNYVLKWRVVITSLVALTGLDTPENIRDPLAVGLATHVVTFSNPRSVDTYGFTELRVENLVDDPQDQTPIIPMVFQKRTTGFSVALSPSPPTINYFLIARTP